MKAKINIKIIMFEHCYVDVFGFIVFYKFCLISHGYKRINVTNG